MEKKIRPSPALLLAAEGKTIRDVIGEGLRVLFCGINPGLYSAALGHHFAKPGNRFWKTLFVAGFTPRLLTPREDASLVEYGLGLTNLVARATRSAGELSQAELAQGQKVLLKKIRRYRPGYLAVLGIGAYRHAFGNPKAEFGAQRESLGQTKLWVLPNPSGLNANYQVAELVRVYKELLDRVFA